MEDKINKFSQNIRLKNENHFLYLRKKIKNKEYYEKKINKLKRIENDKEINKINLDIKEIESIIKEHKIYNIYTKCNNTIQRLGYLLQMIIDNDKNLIIYGLFQINQFLSKINKEEFEAQNLKIQFNENMFKYLFYIIDKKNKDNNILLLFALIIDKLCEFDNQYCIFLINHIYKIIAIIKLLNGNKNQNFIINNLFSLFNNIFLLENFENYKNNLENIGKELLYLIINEIYNINSKESFIFSKKLISTLLTILNNIFINQILFEYVFKYADKIKPKEKNIFDALKYILKNKANFELDDLAIFCLYNFIEYYMEIKEKLSEEDIDEINYRLCDMNIPKFIIPLILDNTENIINNKHILYILKILINTISIGNCQYWSDLIQKNLISQIVKLQEILLNINIDVNSSQIFEYHLLLIFNLVSTEFEEVISHIAIKSTCISNLFKFFKLNNFFVNKQLDLYLNILHGLIINKCKYKKRQCNFRFVKTFLLSEGICEYYKKLLLDEKSLNQELIKNIFIDILVFIEYFGEFVDIPKENIVLLHFQNIGMNDIINNYRNKINFSNELTNIIEDVFKKINYSK